MNKINCNIIAKGNAGLEYISYVKCANNHSPILFIGMGVYKFKDGGLSCPLCDAYKQIKKEKDNG